MSGNSSLDYDNIRNLKIAATKTYAYTGGYKIKTQL